MLKSFTDAAADAIAKAIASVEREAKRNEQLRDAEYRAMMAEQREMFAAKMRAADDKIAAVRDGVDGKDGLPGRDGVDGKDGIDGLPGADGKDGANGLDGKDGEPGKDGNDGVNGIDGKDGAAGADGRDGIDGKDGANGIDGAVGPMGEKGDAGDQGPQGLPGPEAYVGEAKGLWSPDEVYRAMDVVSFNGSEWRAKCDDPGVLPGENWKIASQRGKRGERGDDGKQGPQGLAGPALVAGYIDAKSLKMVLTQDDGAEVKVDLYDLAKEIHSA